MKLRQLTLGKRAMTSICGASLNDYLVSKNRNTLIGTQICKKLFVDNLMESYCRKCSPATAIVCLS